MKTITKRALSLLLVVAMLLPFVAFELPVPAAATNHGEYDTLAMIYDYGTCPSMQGLGLCGDYFYAVKTDGNDTAATVTRVNKNTGAKNMLTNGGNGTYYFYDFGHGNDCEVVYAGGKTNMFIPTSATGANSIVRYTVSGTTATKMCGYQMVSPSGANIGGGAIRAARVDDENIYFLFKSGMTLYTGTLPISQNGGQLVMTKMCTLDTSGVYVNGTYMDLSAFIGQGMGYYDHRVYIPITGNSQASTINQSIILVYDIQGASGTIKPLNDPTFRVTSSAYSALYEIETCVIDPETNLLYYTTNRRKTSSDTNYDGLHWITNWVYEPQKRTTAVENYRWEPVDGKLTSVTSGGSVYNGLAWHGGSMSGSTITDGRYATDRNIVLKHGDPWVVEWKSGGCGASQMLMATQSVSYYADAPYLFITAGNARVSLGVSTGSQYDNYSCNLSSYGVDGSKAQVFRLTNKVASDGSNMVWLSVDGKEVGPLNQYYIGGTSQGTTSNWVSGKDFAFSYLGTNNHPINDSIEYIQVWGDGIRGAVDEPDTFRWETSGNALGYVSGFDYTNNALTLEAGSVSGTTYSAAEYDPAFDIKLLHDRPWSIEWAGSYTGGSMILAADNHGNTEHAPYLFRSGILAFGERASGSHHNYGIRLSDVGISYSDRHVYRLTNRIAADGSNMVYLYVDGAEIGPMNNYFKGTTAQGTTVDWLNGKDLTFSRLGAYGYAVSGEVEYLQVWEGGITADAQLHDYRWEPKDGKLQSVQTGTFEKNEATLHAGVLSGDTFTTPGYAQLDRQIVLRHDQRWSVQWKSEGSYAGSKNGTMLLASSNIGNLEGSAYLFCTSNYGYVTMGVRQNSANHNYGIDLNDHGIDLTAAHTFTLTNEPAADGSNMIWLSVDGVELGAMNNYYKGVTAQGTTSDFLSGKDFAFSFLGTKTYPISCTLEHLQVFTSCAHTYGDWVVDKAATCTETGSRTHSCTICGYSETETIAATGHSYDMVSFPGTCVELPRDQYTCSKCGHVYLDHPESVMSDWVETLPEGIDMSLVETKTQYRYCDYETTTSYETSLPGYTQIGSAWVKSGSGTVNYVNTWATGFSTSSSLYTQYNKKSSKVTASETATTKTVIDSDAVVGYLYHHWCYAGSYYSVQSTSGSYTTFHAFYSTTAPGSLSNYDASDGSYYYPNSSACSNSDWWWPTTVNAQKYTTYNKQFTYERWTDWSDWSDTPVEATDSRKVETRTLYRYPEVQLGEHDFQNGSCVLCGEACFHDWSGGSCTICGMGCGHPSHDTSGTCTTCGVTVQHTYADSTLDPTCTTGGYITHTCTVCGSSYNSDFTAPLGHSYVEGICSDCGKQCPHGKWTDGHCDTCGMACAHQYSDGKCTVCQTAYPVRDYYLFGYIDGADYACEGDYQNMGIYKFVDNKLTATFKQDSYVAVKAEGNADWYMANTYPGDGIAACTLFNTNTGAGEKLFVPGGKQITFTLVNNGDDTFTLSYVAKVCPHPGHGTDGICTACGQTVSHSYTAKTTEATCTAPGETVFTCTVCGHSYSQTIPATGHMYGGWYESKAPTCTEQGQQTRSCSTCGATQTQAIAATGHSWKAADCDDPKTCATCGATEGAALGHSYDSGKITKAPTCTDTGVKTYTCGTCGATKTETVAALGHAYRSVTTAPTCTEPGYTTHTCTNCGDSYTDGNVAATGHSYDSGKITKAPTCTDTGVKTYTCGTCGVTKTETVAALGHAYRSVTTAPTCTEPGYTTHTCTNCGDSYTDGNVAATGHSYDSGKITKAPTCTDTGVKTYTCGTCDATKTETVAALGHAYRSVTTAPTCTEPGYTTHTCTNCGDSYTDGNVAATGHSYDSGKITKAPTCTDTGVKTYTCGTCDATKTETVAALGHAYRSVTTAPTCTEPGHTTHTCTNCGDSYTDGNVAATGHSYDSGKITKAPTCTDTGVKTYTCGTCDATKTETVAALGHAYRSVTTAPTCTEPGYTTHTCATCGDSYTDGNVAATGHSYVDGVCTGCGAADPDAVKDPGLTLNYPTLSFEDEIIYNVYFSVKDTTSIVEMGLMILPKMDQAATIEDATALVPGYVTNGVAYLAKSEGIPAANMGDTLYFKVYAKLTDGSYAYSTAGGYNAKAYANSILNGNNSAEMKSLVVSMLNYGAEAQLYFDHNTDKLVNGALTAEQQALVKAYESTMMDAIVKADSTKTGDFVRVNSNFRSLYPSVSFDGAFAINFYCQPAITVDSSMTLYYWDMETMASVEKLSVSNATGSMEMTDTNGMYWGQVAGIAAKEMDKTYYVTCVFESNGQTVTTGVIPYSLGKYCSDKAAADGDAQQSFAQATAVYGYYAKAYFASIA